jgi:hypothetical protein
VSRPHLPPPRLRRSSATVVAALACLIAGLGAPAGAWAEFPVNNLGDQPDETINGTCDIAGGGGNECTLRAAIEEANSASNVDLITFAGASFNGEDADVITVTSDLPTISEPLNILGGHCETEASPPPPADPIMGPCGRVTRSGSGSLFVVDSDEVTIKGLSITGAVNGINVINESDGFVAKNDWVGINLKGEALGNNTGILLGPGADQAVIGGTEEEDRNVIGGNSAVGLDLEGASGASVLGNYFGVDPKGTSQRSNPKDIEVSDSTGGGGFKAEANEIGTVIGAPARGTPKCDGGCNVIGGATSTGIDLNGDGSGLGEAPASGPTALMGNFIGLGGDGSAVVQNVTYGVLAGAADKVRVGGTGEGENNWFAGGAYGVYGEDGDDLEVLSNVMGRDKSGAPTTAPSAVGIFSFTLNISGPEAAARIAYNSLEMEGGTGIEQRFPSGALILNNDVFGGDTGILTLGSSGEGSLIESNRIRRVNGNGIRIENDSNVVIRNEVEEAGGAGILVKYAGSFPLASGSTGNQIGGGEEEENVLLFNGGPAIEIKDIEETNNEVARNRGEGNTNAFIDLVPAQLSETKGPNEGIKPPAISAAEQTGAEGSGAEPGALIRVFRKASSEPGELESFLEETVANGSGAWKVSYPAALPTGTIVAATQTSVAGGTSELATATTAAPPEQKGGGNGGGGGGGGGAKDKTPPQTKIVRGPPKKTHKRTVKFKFTSSEQGSTFKCKLDRKPFKRCTPPKKYKKLKPGKHVFKVFATDKAGNKDPTPAVRKFRVLR